MSNTIIKNILSARKSATSRVPKVKAEDLSLYNRYGLHQSQNKRVQLKHKNNSHHNTLMLNSSLDLLL